MKKNRTWADGMILGLAIMCALFISPKSAKPHCDTMDGPVIKDAQMALARGDVTPVLKWVKPENEAEIKAAFSKALVVRTKGPEAKELADNYFFETLVRIHRAGEGAPYTGLKPAGTDLGPAVKEADLALQSGKLQPLTNLLTGSVAQGLKERHEKVMSAKKHKDESVAAGREFVEAYVEYVHYAEKVYELSHESGGDHAEEAGHSEHH